MDYSHWVHVFSQRYLLYPLGHPASLTSLWEESLSPGFPLLSAPVLLLSLCPGHLLPAALKFPELRTHGSLMPTPDSSASPSRKHLNHPEERHGMSLTSLAMITRGCLLPLLFSLLAPETHPGCTIAFRDLLQLQTPGLCALRGMLVHDACKTCIHHRGQHPGTSHIDSFSFSGTCLDCPQPRWPLAAGKVTQAELWSLGLTFHFTYSALYTHFPVERRWFSTPLLPFLSPETCSLTLGDSFIFGHLVLSRCFILSQSLSLPTKSHDPQIRNDSESVSYSSSGWQSSYLERKCRSRF